MRKYTDDVDEYGTYVVVSKYQQKRGLIAFKKRIEKLNEPVTACDFCGQIMRHNDTVSLWNRTYHKICADAVTLRVYKGLKELGIFDDNTG